MIVCACVCVFVIIIIQFFYILFFYHIGKYGSCTCKIFILKHRFRKRMEVRKRAWMCSLSPSGFAAGRIQITVHVPMCNGMVRQ